jgi:hypothetical protein
VGAGGTRKKKKPPAQAVWLGCLDLYCYRWGTSKSLS